MKKLICLVLAVLMTSFVLCSCATQTTERAKNLYYVEEDARASLTTTVTVPESVDGVNVTVIDESALEGASEVKKVVLPETVQKISYFAFKNCSALAEINFPASLSSVEREAFYGTALTEIVLPGSVTEIGGYAFADCKALTSVTLTAGIKRIGNKVFDGCDSLTSLTFVGTEEQWNSVVKGSDNDKLNSLTVTFVQPE